jgi:hypothetical protein
MRELWYLVRFFLVVPPVPLMMTGTFGVLLLISIAAIVGDVGSAAGALVPVLILQAFAASSGFALPARRGHYDLLFTRGSSRTLIAIVHWVMSIAPGVASWLILSVVEFLVSRGASYSLTASGTCAAMLLVSTLPWAVTVALPRFAGGLGWMLVAATTATTFSTGVLDGWAVSSATIDESTWRAWSFFLYPANGIGRHLAEAELTAVLPALTVAVCAMVMACRWVAHRDVPLEAAQ